MSLSSSRSFFLVGYESFTVELSTAKKQVLKLLT